MSFEPIAIIILIGSILGMGVILSRKIPALVKLPDYAPPSTLTPLPTIWYKKLIEKIKILNPFKYFSHEIFLQRILSKIRILTLKTDNKTSSWLQRLRESSQKKKFKENDNYWKEIEKLTKDKKTHLKKNK